MKLSVCGIPRSGSTLLWQVASHLFPNTTIGQTHPGVPPEPNTHYLMSIRHPFDIAASRYRIRLSRGGEQCAGPEGLEAEIGEMRKHFTGVPAIMETGARMFYYEVFYTNFQYLIDVFNYMENQMGVGWGIVENTKSLKAELTLLYSFSANKRRADKLKDFNSIDPKTKIHGDHIGSVVPGGWKRDMPKWGQAMIVDLCSDIAEEYNYEIG